MSFVMSAYSAGFSAALYGSERVVPTAYDLSEIMEWLRGFDTYDNFRTSSSLGLMSISPQDLFNPRATQASLINEQAAQILNLERELKLAHETVAGLIKKTMERELSDLLGPKRLSASWESQPDVTAPVAAPFPLRALRPGRQVGTVRTGLYE